MSRPSVTAPSTAETAEAVFVPGDPLRFSTLALWDRDRPEEPVSVTDGPLADRRDQLTVGPIELVLPAGSRVRTTVVSALLVPWRLALDWLVELTPSHDVTASLAGWAVAARLGTDLVARGRLIPSISPSGFDTWRLGLLDPTDQQHLDVLAAALPAVAHALAVNPSGSGPRRIASPDWLVRQAVDAVADVMVRTAATPYLVEGGVFAGPERHEISALQPWLTQVEHDLGIGAGAHPGIRLEIPFGDVGLDLDHALDPAARSDDDGPVDAVPPVRAVLQLRSRVDPSLVIDAADLWTAPASVHARMGEQAEVDLLLALRRGASVWPPLERALHDASPGRLDITDEEAFELLGPPAQDLAAVGFEVLWPSGVFEAAVELRANLRSPEPGSDNPAGFTFDTLVSFDWQASIDGTPLTNAELVELAEAKRPLIRLRGRWVRADPTLLERLRSRSQLRAGDALAAALTGSLVVDGEQVGVDVEDGPLATLAERLRAVGGDAPDEMDEPDGLVATLRPYQRRGLAWMAAMTDLGLGGCLADDMGLGKTVQLIALHVHRHPPKGSSTRAGSVDQDPSVPGAGERNGPTLVVCPTSVLGNWEREINRFAPGVPVRRFHGGDRHLDDIADDEMVLVTYGLLRRDVGDLAAVAWGMVVADEAQHAKNPLSRTARALRAIPAPSRIALTGTPVENRLTELWSILDWTTPGLLGPLEIFRRTIAVPVERHQDPLATERLAGVVRPFLLRRRKSDPGIAPELPPKTERDLIVPLTVEQVTLYEATVRESLEAIKEKQGFARRGLVLRLLTMLKQITNHPAQFLGQDGPLDGRSGKLDALDELLEVVVSEGDSVLVFTQYVQMGLLLERHLADAGIATRFLHGGVPARRRELMVDEFQAGRAPVMLLSLKAGGTGLNLTRATHVVHYDRWWNPAVEDQATDRAYRIGQDRPVQVHKLVTEGTIEDRVALLLAAKRELAESVIGSGEGWIGDLSDDELTDLVSLRALSYGASLTVAGSSPVSSPDSISASSPGAVPASSPGPVGASASSVGDDR